MAQFARPDADVTDGGWVLTGFGTGDLYGEIDEVTPNDADFIQSSLNPANDTCEVSLSDVQDPETAVGHIVRYRYQKSVTGGRQQDLTVALIQGTTIIASWVHTNIDALTQANQTLTAGQANAITDYTDLRFRFTANTLGGGAGRRTHVTWAELEVPTKIEMQGTIAGSGGLSADRLEAFLNSSADVDGQGALSGDLTTFDSIKGQIDGTSTVGPAKLERQPLGMSGTISGSSALSGNAVVARNISGQLDGDGFLSSNAFVTRRLLAEDIDGQGAMSGKLFATSEFIGSIDGQGELDADLFGYKAVKGQLDGDSFLSSKLNAFVPLSGQIDGQGSASGGLAKLANIDGQVDGSGDMSADLFGEVAISGQLDGQGGLVGDMTTFDSLKGYINAQGGLSAPMQLAQLAMAGSIDGVGNFEKMPLTLFIAVSGDIAGEGSFASKLEASVPLGAAQIDAQGSLSAPKLDALVTLPAGLASGSGALQGDLTTFDSLQGQLDAQGGLAAALGLIMPFAGAIDGQSSIQGTLVEFEPIAAGRIDGVGSLSGKMVRRPLGMSAVIHPQPKAFHGQSSLVGESILPELEIGDVTLPDEGASSIGGYLVTVEGENFKLPPEPPSGYVGGMFPRTVKVEIGGVASPDVRVLSPTLLTFVAPPYGGPSNVDPIPAQDIRIVNIDPDTGAELGEGNEATIPGGFQYARPAIGSSQSSHLLRTTRELLRVFKRQIFANTSLTTHTDYDDDVADMLDTVKVSELPAVVLVGPTLVENRFYSINQKQALQNGREYKRPRTPRTVDVSFEVVGVSDKTYILLNLIHAIEAFFEANKWLYVDRDPDNLSLGQVRYEMDPVDEMSVESRSNEDNVRNFRGSFVLRGFDVELEAVETSYELDDAATDGQVTLQVESI